MSEPLPDGPIAVLYGGAVGLSLFAELLGQRPDIRFYTGNSKTLERLAHTGQISITGVLNETISFPPTAIFDDISAAASGASIIFCAAPAYMHAKMIKQISAVLQPGQLIVLMPGRVFGSLEVEMEIACHRPDLAGQITIAELQTVLYACRTAADGTVLMMGRKEQVSCSLLSSEAQETAGSGLFALIPELKLVSGGFLETSLNTVGPTLHTIPLLLNVEIIENQRSRPPLRFYQDLISSHIADLCMELDQERLSLAHRLGVTAVSILDWISDTYGVKETELKRALDQVPAYGSVPVPKIIQHRYLLEDVPYGLVPFASLGEAMGLPMTATRRVISLADRILGCDFNAEGRTVERLGLDVEAMVAQAHPREKVSQ
jgi:opine dehydrogenase